MQPTLRPAQHLNYVYLYRDPIDFRKSYRGLSALIEMELGHNPFSGNLYAFTNKRRNKIKCLFWENNGFVLYYKALAEEKFKWPKRTDEVITLTGYGKIIINLNFSRFSGSDLVIIIHI